MAIRLKPLDQQVVVITGASSGIGLATALAAAERGASLVLTACSEDTLQEVVREIGGRGGTAIAVAADLADRDAVERVARVAVERFGRIDGWVNDAGVSINGRLDEVSEEDSRRLFDTNFWGVVNGSLAALPHLRENGGALINIGSEVSGAAVPPMGMYTASKHAVKGFTDALRMEVQQLDDAPVAITLVQPTASDSPVPRNARNHTDREPTLPTPQSDPSDVAEVILEALETPARNAKVCAKSGVNTLLAKVAPPLAERLDARQEGGRKSDEAPGEPEGALFSASESGRVGGTGGRRDD